MIDMNPICKHGTAIAQTQCKYCMNDELIELRSQLDSIRAATIQECWDAINAHIQRGPLPGGGNGTDAHAQRNGMVLATNILYALLEPPK